jgi:hypothetical protein
MAILVYGYKRMDWLLIMIGSTFSVMAIANTQCGPFASSCKVDHKEEEQNGSS